TIAHTLTRDSPRGHLHPLIPDGNGLSSTPRPPPSRTLRSTHNIRHSVPAPSAVLGVPCDSVADAEQLARPCIQAGFQRDDTGVAFCLLGAPALLFRF